MDETDTEAADRVRVWLVERTDSDDEQNPVILTDATPDGRQYYRKERTLTSFTDTRDTTAGVDTRLQTPCPAGLAEHLVGLLQSLLVVRLVPPVPFVARRL